MKPHRAPQGEDNVNKSDRIVNRYLTPLALVGGLLLIIFVTLNSFDFHARPMSAARYFDGFLFYPSSYLDFPLNVILFMPFGFGLASLLDQARLSKRATFVAVLLAGFLLTWFVESLQFFLPGRTPNVSDLAANTFGAAAGLGCFRIWQNRRKFFSLASQPRYLVISLLIYLLLLSSLGIVLRDHARLDNWRLRFPLLIGNEKSGDRPWAGQVSDLAILDRALPINDVESFLLGGELVNIAGDSLVAYYPLENPASLSDQTGNLSDLYWSGDAAVLPEEDAQQLDGRSWLRTEWAVIYLTEKLAATSQFTLLLSVATADLEQTGPARIVSVSATPYYRNLTVGQEGQDLVVRVRMPLTGLNGTVPELVFPNIFVDEDPHQLIVTYDGLALRVYVDEAKEAHRVDIVPGLTFFFAFYAPFVLTVAASATSSKVFMILFYLLVFGPVGFILALIGVQTRFRLRWLLLLVAGIGVSALLLEVVLTARNGYELRLANILLAAVVTTVSYLLLTPVARKLIDSR